MASTNLDHAKYWSDRAEEVRVLAEMMSDPYTKRTLLLIAQGYDVLVERTKSRNSQPAQASRLKTA